MAAESSPSCRRFTRPARGSTAESGSSIGTRIGGDLRADVADVESTAAALEAWLGRQAGTLMSARVSGGVGASAKAGRDDRAPRGRGVHQRARLWLSPTPAAIALGGGIRYTPASLDGRQARRHVGRRHGACRRSRRAVESPATVDRLRGRSAAGACRCSTVAGHRPRGRPGHDVVVRAHAAGTVGNPSVEASLRGADLACANERLGDCAADVALTGRQVAVTQLVLDKPQPDGNGPRVCVGPVSPRHGRVHLRRSGPPTFSSLGLTLPDGRRSAAESRLNGKGRRLGRARRPAS